MLIRGLERLPKEKEFWYNVSGPEATTALDILFKRLREMLLKKLLPVPDSGSDPRAVFSQLTLLMKSAGCQMENEMSAGCEIWPSLDWGTDLETGSAWADGCPHRQLIISSTALAISGKIPWIFTQENEWEDQNGPWWPENQLIKELIFQLLLSKGASFSFSNESCNKQVCIQYVLHALCVPLDPLKGRPLQGTSFDTWSVCQNHGWTFAGVILRIIYQVNLNLSHPKWEKYIVVYFFLLCF